MDMTEEQIENIFKKLKKKPFPRPESEEYPKVWLKFEGRPDENGRIRKFRIQDLTEEYFDDVLGWAEHFVKEEKTNSLFKFYEDRKFIVAVKVFWQYLLEQKVSVICLTDDEDIPTMAGFNANEIVTKEEAAHYLFNGNFLPKLFQTQGKVIAELKTKANLFERFDSDRYMDAMGLFVLPEFRRNGIAEKLLAARIPLCKMLGIKGTANTFSSHPVRRVAAKVGFEVYGEISMAEIGKKINKDWPEDEFVKLMGFKIV